MYNLGTRSLEIISWGCKARHPSGLNELATIDRKTRFCNPWSHAASYKPFTVLVIIGTSTVNGETKGQFLHYCSIFLICGQTYTATLKKYMFYCVIVIVMILTKCIDQTPGPSSEYSVPYDFCPMQLVPFLAMANKIQLLSH